MQWMTFNGRAHRDPPQFLVLHKTSFDWVPDPVTALILFYISPDWLPPGVLFCSYKNGLLDCKT